MLLGKVGTITTTPPKRGAPSAATVSVYGSGVTISPTVSVDTTNTAVVSAARIGATEITVEDAPALGLVELVDEGRRDLVEVVAVHAVGSHYKVTLGAPLAVAVSANADMLGCRLSATIPADTWNEPTRATARWTATVNGETLVWDTVHQVERTAPPWCLTVPELQRLLPEWALIRNGKDNGVADMIHQAHTGWLWPELESRGVELETVRSWSVFVPAVVEHIRLTALQVDGAVMVDRLEWQKAQRQEALTKALSAVSMYKTATTEQTSPTEPTPLSSAGGWRSR